MVESDHPIPAPDTTSLYEATAGTLNLPMKRQLTHLSILTTVYNIHGQQGGCFLLWLTYELTLTVQYINIRRSQIPGR